MTVSCADDTRRYGRRVNMGGADYRNSINICGRAKRNAIDIMQHGFVAAHFRAGYLRRLCLR